MVVCLDDMLVSVVFHHHQPWYIDRKGNFDFRWIFDHTGNYMRHLELVRERPELRLTYNLSPTLLRQWMLVRSGKFGLDLHSPEPDMELQRAQISELLAGYMERNGKNIEVISQPYYHPIMPLLLKHGLKQDLEWQLLNGRKETEGYTGKAPAGMWSPECAFSPETVRPVQDAGFSYTVLDMSALQGRHAPECPFVLPDGLKIFFRDNDISNAFSFSWPMQKPDVIERELASMLSSRKKERWRSVVIALDGENWMNGSDHLGALARVLCNTNGMRPATLSDIAAQTEAQEIDSIPQTSWAMDHTFSTWEGSRAKNMQWSLIDQARDAIAGADPESKEKARAYLRIAEGSDYTYWDFDKPGALAEFGMSYAKAAVEAASPASVMRH